MPGFLHHLRRLYSSSSSIRPKSETLTLDSAMSTFTTSPSTTSLNSLLFACLLSGRPHLAPSLFRDHQSKIPPNLDTYNTLLKNYAALSSTSAIYSLLPEMRARSISPNQTTFSIAIAGFYSENNLADVNNVLFLMSRSLHRSPSLSIYNTRIQGLCKLGRPHDAMELLKEMRSKRMKTNCVTYGHLVLGFCSVGDLEMARKAFEEMGRRGIVPESGCYFSLVHYLCKGGEFEAAAAVCRESIGRNWVPRFGTMKMLVEGLAGVRRKEEARGFVEEVKKRFPENAELWKEVEEGFLQ